MPAVVYTMFGGVQAVTWTDVKTMTLIVCGLFAMIVFAWLGLPDGVGVTDGLAAAASTGRPLLISTGMALLGATLCAKGQSIMSNVEQIDRGYEDLDTRLRALGAKIERAA